MINSIWLLVVLSALTHAGCTAPSCPSSVASCPLSPGCSVEYAQTPTCSFKPLIQCYGASQSSCTTANGCEWDPPSGGHCFSEGACYGLTVDTCFNAGCKWTSSDGGCYTKDCRYGEAQCKDVSNGCQWISNYCGGPDYDTCRAITVEDKCRKEDTGCEWRDGECAPAYGLNCVDNDAGTGCNRSSDVGCWWQSGYCTSGVSWCSYNKDQTSCNNDASKVCEWETGGGWCSDKCSENDAGTACAAGVPTYCQWEANSGECGELNMYCQTTKDNSGCTESSDTRCSRQTATTESCSGELWLLLTCPLEGDSCSVDALDVGCVNSDSVNSDSTSAAFIIRDSLMAVFAAFLSIFFL